MAYVRPETRHRRVQQMGPETKLRKIIVQEPASLGAFLEDLNMLPMHLCIQMSQAIRNACGGMSWATCSPSASVEFFGDGDGERIPTRDEYYGC